MLCFLLHPVESSEVVTSKLSHWFSLGYVVYRHNHPCAMCFIDESGQLFLFVYLFFTIFSFIFLLDQFKRPNNNKTKQKNSNDDIVGSNNRTNSNCDNNKWSPVVDGIKKIAYLGSTFCVLFDSCL